MAFGAPIFGSGGDGSVIGAMNEKRINPMMQLAKRTATPVHDATPAPHVTKAAVKPKNTPSHKDVHAHLDNAKKATSDVEKRGHVFKALTALNRRAGKNPQPLPDMGAT